MYTAEGRRQLQANLARSSYAKSIQGFGAVERVSSVDKAFGAVSIIYKHRNDSNKAEPGVFRESHKKRGAMQGTRCHLF